MRNFRVPGILLALAAAGLLLFGAWWIATGVRWPGFDTPSVLAQVQQLSHLTTVKYTVQKVIGLKEQKQPVGSESILLIVQANVQAGVDLGVMRPDDISIRPDGTVVLQLPRARIFDVAIDEKETRVWDRRKTWWTPWVPYSLDLEQKARLAGLEAAKQAAMDMGILAQAERNAETSIRSLLELAGVKSVVVVPGSAS